MLDIKGQKWNICRNTNTRDKGVGNANTFTFFIKRVLDFCRNFSGLNVKGKDTQLSNKISNLVPALHFHMPKIQLKCGDGCNTRLILFKEFYEKGVTRTFCPEKIYAYI